MFVLFGGLKYIYNRERHVCHSLKVRDMTSLADFTILCNAPYDSVKAGNLTLKTSRKKYVFRIKKYHNPCRNHKTPCTQKIFLSFTAPHQSASTKRNNST